MLFSYSVDRRSHVIMKAARTCKKTRAILDAIIEGKTFEQILGRYPKLGCHDIFRAAAQASLGDSPDKAATTTRVLEYARVAATSGPASPTVLRASD
jgi:hypothetical protein